MHTETHLTQQATKLIQNTTHPDQVQVGWDEDNQQK